MSEPEGAKEGRRVLVAGAAGFLGRAICTGLLAAGYPTRGLVRDPTQVPALERAGVEVVVGDVLDAPGVRRAAEGVAAAVHVAATYPGPGVSEALAHRVRVEGAQNLADALAQAGGRRLVLGSGYWVYADHAGVLSADAPLDPRGESKVNHDAERAALARGVPGRVDVVIVRPGMVYGNGSWLRGMVDAVRAGEYRYPGPGENRWSLISLEDTARAFVSVLERGRNATAYLAVDDAPIPLRDLVGLIAAEVGARTPSGVPPEELSRTVAPEVVHHLAANRAGSNARLRELGWTPRVPDCRSALPQLLRTMTGTSGRTP